MSFPFIRWHSFIFNWLFLSSIKLFHVALWRIFFHFYSELFFIPRRTLISFLFCRFFSRENLFFNLWFCKCRVNYAKWTTKNRKKEKNRWLLLRSCVKNWKGKDSLPKKQLSAVCNLPLFWQLNLFSINKQIRLKNSLIFDFSSAIFSLLFQYFHTLKQKLQANFKYECDICLYVCWFFSRYLLYLIPVTCPWYCFHWVKISEKILIAIWLISEWLIYLFCVIY